MRAAYGITQFGKQKATGAELKLRSAWSPFAAYVLGTHPTTRVVHPIGLWVGGRPSGTALHISYY